MPKEAIGNDWLRDLRNTLQSVGFDILTGAVKIRGNSWHWSRKVDCDDE